MNPIIQLQKLWPAMQWDGSQVRPLAALQTMSSWMFDTWPFWACPTSPPVGSAPWQCWFKITALFIPASLEEEVIRTGAFSSLPRVTCLQSLAPKTADLPDHPSKSLLQQQNLSPLESFSISLGWSDPL